MQRIIENDGVVDIVTLPAELDRHKDLVTVGGSATSASLLDGVPDRPSMDTM